MRNCSVVIIASLALALAGCSRDSATSRDARRTADDLTRDANRAAKKAGQELRKAGKEIGEQWDKGKREVEAPHKTPEPAPRREPRPVAR